MKEILVTGTAGFIGFHLCKKLLKRGDTVIGIDNLNDYYDVNLKKARLAQLDGEKNFTFTKMPLEDNKGILSLFESGKFDYVVNLAAQAGVRYSMVNPYSYINSNICGFMNILEGCRHHGVKHLVFASSSSVYGLNTRTPFSVHHNVDHPASLYGATKKANELMAHAYSHLFKIPVTGLRFFTVYGPWGRPDMALFLFTKAILEGKAIDIFNHGKMQRDFTYIDDITEGIVRILDRVPSPNPDWDANQPDPGTSSAPYKLYNIGNNNPVQLLRFIEILEETLGEKARKNLLPMQPGDLPETYANVDNLTEEIGLKPGTSIEEGIKNFVEWYKLYYKVDGKLPVRREKH